TAQAYGNERMLGEAWRKSGLKREELFITTKIAVEHFGYHRAKDTFAESLKNLQTDYVDLLLLHFPVSLLRKKSWLALEEIQAAGQAKSIGVSNYMIRHLEEMQHYANVLPAVNQVELHVFLQQPELVKYCQEQGITVEAYSPLARGNIMDNEVVSEIAQKHGKTYAQVMLRFLVEQGLVVIPKSVTPDRIKENFEIFDFKLDGDDMEILAKEDLDRRFCWSPVHVP
ncbi:MAG TPA: aldo/keto reductase, partial [Candidatus Saccharimonadia bacterium]|nr:aldo/keto reductase [Candidatus Saccharimonadia bacterium]